MKNNMIRPNFFIVFLMLCASSAWGDELPDSASSNGVVPGMGWDTTATTRIIVADEFSKAAARRFTLQGFTVQNQFRNRCGILLEKNRKIIIIK